MTRELSGASDRLGPVVRRLDEVEVLEADQWPGGFRLARLITKAETGSDVLLGACWLEPGRSTSFDLTEDGDGPVRPQELYFIVSGVLSVRSSEGTVEAAAGAAIYFPPGDAYTVTAMGEDQVHLLYTAAPAPR